MYSSHNLLYHSIIGNDTNETCIPWIEKGFKECLHNTKEEIGFICGLISILCWLSSALPQLWENYKTKNFHEACSPYFLLLWLIGDSANLVGCILVNEFPIQLYTAIYYVTMDMIMNTTWVYYYLRAKAILKREGIDGKLSTSSTVLSCILLGFVPLYMLHNIQPSNTTIKYGRLNRSLLSIDGDNHWTKQVIIGYAVGCSSSVLYFGSRIPQIYKNYKRGRTKGVSWMLFFLAVCGNALYGTSILLQDPSPGDSYTQFIIYQLPWLVGSLGTMSLDFTILSQIAYYSRKNRGENNQQHEENDNILPNERTPLIA